MSAISREILNPIVERNIKEIKIITKKYSKHIKKWEYSKRTKDEETGIFRETWTSTEQITKLVAEYFQSLVWGFTAETGVSQC